MHELDLFAEAVAIADPSARAALLDRHCIGQPALRERIEQLLDAHGRPNPALDQPAFAPANTESQFVAAPDPATREAIGAIVAGKYKLLEKIGEGGMGEVWVADQLAPIKRRVALKLIKPGMDSRSVIGRFEAERQALAVMDHANIAKVLDAGTTQDGRPYFVMELVKGTPITDFCDARRLTPSQRLDLFVSVCHAIQHAHSKGIIHRDIKPSNVLVALHDEAPVPKVIDFGVAKAIGQQLTEKTIYTGFGALIGTPAYMAPEQATFNQLDVDTRADVYALGVLLYELLAGSPPIEKERLKQAALEEVLRIVRDEEPPRPSQRLSTSLLKASIAATRQSDPAKLSQLMRGELDWIVLKALEKDRTRRYDTALGLARDIQRYLANEVVEARPPTMWYRYRKFSQRHRGAILASYMLLIGVVVFVGSLYSQMERAKTAERLAVAAQQAEAERADGERHAKLAAEAQKEQAQNRLKQIEKGNAVLTSIFDDLNMEAVKDGTDPLEAVLAKRLVKAAEQLEGASVGDPLIVAGLQYKLGETLISLGFPQEAVLLCQKSKDTRHAVLGADHPDTLDVKDSLAGGYLEIGKLDLALSLYEETLQLRKLRLGPVHSKTLESMNNLAHGYLFAGNHDKAIPLFEDALKMLKATHDVNTLTCMNNLALAYQAAGKPDRALPLLEETLKARRERNAADHWGILASMNNLSTGYANSRKDELSLALIKETLEYAKAKLGVDHPRTLTAMANLGISYLNARRFSQALPLLEETLKLEKIKFGIDHPSTFATMRSLGNGYIAVRRFDQGLPLLEETLKLAKAKLGPDHPETLLAMGSLAKGYLLAEKVDQALRLLEETLKLTKEKQGADHPSTLDVMHNLAAGYSDAKRFEESILLAEEVLRRREAKLGRDHPATLSTMSNLASFYLKVGKPKLALPLLEKAVTLLKIKLPNHPETLSGMGHLANAYQAVGRLELAVPLFEETQKLMKANLDKDHPFILTTTNNLALAYKAAKKLDLALPLFDETLKVRKETLEPDHPKILTSMNNLAGAYQATGKLHLALPLFEETFKLRKVKLGPDHPDTLNSMNNLACAYRAAGRPELELPLLEETLKRRKAKLGPDHPETLISISNLAVAFADAGKLELALPLYEEALTGRKATLGPDHPETLKSIDNLAKAYRNAGKPEQALSLYEEALRRRKSTLGLDHPDTLTSMNNLAGAYWRRKQFDKSIPLLKEVLKQREAKLGRDNQITLRIVANLGVNYKDAGQLNEAIPLLEESYRAAKKHAALQFVGPQLLDAYEKAGATGRFTALLKEQLVEVRKTLPKDSPQLAGRLATVGTSLLHAKAYTEAELHLRECLSIREKGLPDAWTTFNTQSLLGEALLGQKKYTDAEPLLLAGFKGMKQREKSIPPQVKDLRLHEAAKRLIEFYTATNKPDDLKKWQIEWAKFPPKAEAGSPPQR